MKMNARIIRLAILALVSAPYVVDALCMDPKREISGYKVPLSREIHNSDAIVVGHVLSEQALMEDPTDPDGVTAYNVTIAVTNRLKGNISKVFVVRNDNTSARYAMSIGEEHLLFVSRDASGFWINGCGNSAMMPEGKRLLSQIQISLRKTLK